jgi:hypothetical protein
MASRFPTVCLVLLLAGCGADTAPTLRERAAVAFSHYRSDPNAENYSVFLRVNRQAAREHHEPFDAEGIGYQVNALEIESLEAARTNDADLAEQVTDRIRDLETHDLVTACEDKVPGSRLRLLDAKARVEKLIR